jgi:hypothetical protein
LTQGNAQIYGKEIRIYRARYTVSFSEYSPIFVLAGKDKKISLLMHLGIYSWKLPLFKKVLTLLKAITHITSYLETTNI